MLDLYHERPKTEHPFPYTFTYTCIHISANKTLQSFQWKDNKYVDGLAPIRYTFIEDFLYQMNLLNLKTSWDFFGKVR